MNKNELMKGFNDYFVLSLLMENDSYGYELSRNLFNYTNSYYQIRESTLYTVLQRLSSFEYVKSYQGEKTHGKTRTYYQITDSGRNYYERLKDEIQDVLMCIESFKISMKDN